MSEPLVSIIVPTYNRAALLREAIASVHQQTYGHWELLVIDDGSTDDTLATLAQLDDARLRLVRVRHAGNPALVRNAGLAVARGKYVAFLDDDDLWLQDKLARQLNGLRISGCRWGYTAFRRINAAGGELNEDNVQTWRPYRGWILEPLLSIDVIIPLPTVMVERSLLGEVGGFDETLRDCEDYELWFRLAARERVHVEEAVLTSVRVHRDHRQADRERVHASWVRVYQKTADAATDARLRALCLRRRADHEVLLARLLLARGCRASSLVLLARSARLAAGTRGWWKALTHSLLPKRAVAVFGAIRGGPPQRQRIKERQT